MRRGFACAAATAAAFCAQAANASAEYLCVPNINIPGCPLGAAGENTIQHAANNGKNGDTVLVAAGTYPESVDDMNKSLTFIGAGPTKTVIQGQGVTAMNIGSSGSSVQNLGIDLGNGPGNTGLFLSGHATNVAITATQPASTMNNIGVALNGGTFSHGTVTLPLTGGDVSDYGGVVGSGTLTDSSVTAAVGISSDAGGFTPNLARDRILANQGIVVGGTGTPDFDDSLIRTIQGAAPQLGIGTSPLWMSVSFDMRHITVIGTAATGSTGVSAVADAAGNPATTSVLLESSIVRGYATSISAAASGIFPASTTVTVRHSFYDPASSQASTNASIVKDSHTGNLDPLFVNPAAGDFHLRAGSPAIDAGEPTLGSGESTTDLDGNPRLIAGHRGDAAISDVGAYEFRPHSPTVNATVSALKIAPGKPDTFHATGTDASPGDAVAFRWNFGDGSTGAGATVSHAFARAGDHHVTVIATDLDGFTAGASLTITVPGPAVTKLSIKPGRFRSRVGARISYTASQEATTTFSVLRAKTGLLVGRLTHKGHAGKNHFHFAGKLKGHALRPGRYRLVATPRNSAGAGRPVSVKFTITG